MLFKWTNYSQVSISIRTLNAVRTLICWNTLSLSLSNDQGLRGPYLVNINVINTPPQYEGKGKLSIIEEVSVRLNEKFVLKLPNIINLEN